MHFVLFYAIFGFIMLHYFCENMHFATFLIIFMHFGTQYLHSSRYLLLWKHALCHIFKYFQHISHLSCYIGLGKGCTKKAQTAIQDDQYRCNLHEFYVNPPNLANEQHTCSFRRQLPSTLSHCTTFNLSLALTLRSRQMLFRRTSASEASDYIPEVLGPTGHFIRYNTIEH